MAGDGGLTVIEELLVAEYLEFLRDYAYVIDDEVTWLPPVPLALLARRLGMAESDALEVARRLEARGLAVLERAPLTREWVLRLRRDALRYAGGLKG